MWGPKNVQMPLGVGTKAVLRIDPGTEHTIRKRSWLFRSKERASQAYRHRYRIAPEEIDGSRQGKRCVENLVDDV